MLTKKKIFHIIFLLLFAVFEFSLTQLPLVNLLSYEFSFVHSILFSLIATVYGSIEKDNLKHQLYLYSTLITVSIIIGIISTKLCNECPIDDGLFFYLVFVIPSFVIGTAIAYLAQFMSHRFRLQLAIIIWFILLFSFFPELYFNPQIYFYNPIFVYYPGVIYDYTIKLSKEIIIYRSINLIFAFLVIGITNKFKSIDYIKKSIVIGLIFAIAVTFFKNKSVFNFATDQNRIKNELPNIVETEHFKIFLPDSINVKQKKIITFEHEFYYSSLEEVLKESPQKKITSLIFKDKKHKKKVFGAGNADVAKPWLNEIYIDIESYDNSLKHELAHVFSAQLVNNFLKLPSNLNPALIEGFAMALENNYGNQEIDNLTALAFKNNYSVSLTELFTNLSFFSNTSSLSYLYTGSFIKYLASEYSWDHVKKLYKSSDFKKVFNQSLINLEKQFKRYLAGYEISDNKNKADFYFGRLPIVKLKCARATAKQLSEADKLFELGKYSKAEIKYKEIYDYSNHYRALAGYSKAALMLGNSKKAIKIIKNKLPEFKNTAYYYNFISLLGDLNTIVGDVSKAYNYYNMIVKANIHNYYTANSLMKISLLKSDLKLAKEFLIYPEKRKNILLGDIILDANDSNIKLFCLQESIYNNYNNYIEEITSAVSNNELSADTFLYLAKLSYQNLDFERAKYFIHKAYLSKLSQNKTVLEDFSKKVFNVIEYFNKKK